MVETTTVDIIFVMGEIAEQELYERLANSGCQPFDYEAQSLKFHLAHFEVDLSYDALADANSVLRNVPNQTPEALSEQYLVRNPQGGTYIMPRLSQFLADTDLGQREQLRTEARSAMRQAYYFLTDEIVPEHCFGVHISPDGEIDTAVMSYAHLFRTAVGRFGESTWSHGVYEIGTNNEELPGYEQTLYVGLGSVACQVRSMQEQTN